MDAFCAHCLSDQHSTGFCPDYDVPAHEAQAREMRRVQQRIRKANRRGTVPREIRIDGKEARQIMSHPPKNWRAWKGIGNGFRRRDSVDGFWYELQCPLTFLLIFNVGHRKKFCYLDKKQSDAMVIWMANHRRGASHGKR